MKCFMSVMSCCLVIFTANVLSAQETPEMPKPVKEHELLKKFVGEWTSESKFSGGPDQPEMTCTGTMSAREVGGFWIVSEFKGTPGGQPMTAQLTLGYDPEKGHYTGTWIDSMTSHLWQYRGSYDKEAKTLTLEAKGPNFFESGELTNFRDAYQFVSEGHIVLMSSMQTEDGNWVQFMSGDLKRTE